MSRLARLLFASVASSAQSAPGDYSVIIPKSAGVHTPESVIFDNGFLFASHLGNENNAISGIYKYDMLGAMVPANEFTPVKGVTTRGLALTADKSTLYAAQDFKVSKYIVNSDGLTLDTEYPFAGYKPNGLCFSEDEGKLYVTDPGYNLGPFGVAVVRKGGFFKIDLSSGAISTIFTNQTAKYSPNGCTVDGHVVYLASFQHGVHTYNEQTDAMTSTVAWSEELKTVQRGRPQQCGDGIVSFGGKFYISLWHITFRGSRGAIYVCDPSAAAGSQCSVFAAIPTADLDIMYYYLLAPDLIQNQVYGVNLPHPTASLTQALPGNASGAARENIVHNLRAVAIAQM